MKLPQQVQNSQSGQILIIFLLILVVGLAIVLSIASRTVTDVRQTTTSDESNRAYFAAESGVENALKKIQESPGYVTDPNHIANVDLSTVNRSSAGVTVANLSVSGVPFEFPNKIAKDDVAQVNLLHNFNDITTAGNGGAKSIKRANGLTVYWANQGLGPINTPVIEVSIVTCDSGSTTNCSATPSFHIYKWTFDPSSRVNSFCNIFATPVPFDTTEGTVRPFNYSATFNFTSRVGTDCPVNDLFATLNDQPVLARIRVLYSGSTQIAVKTATGADLPDQGSKITSIGSTPSGVTRKLTVTRLYPALPAIFDYVLYNGSTTQPLSKP